MAETRHDVHRPAALVTEDYEFIHADAHNLGEGVPGWVARNGDYGLDLARWVARTDKLDRGTHQCHHCGAHLNYFAILKHVPTGDAIVVGETCLENRFERATDEFHRLRKLAQLGREAAKVRAEVEAFVAEYPDLAFLADKGFQHTNDFVADVAAKLRKYGNLTEKQVAAVRRAVVRDAERAERIAAEEAAKAAGLVEPAPAGRANVTGEVLTVKVQEGYYGTEIKFLVKDDRGFKVWGTVPRAILDAAEWPAVDNLRGKRVKFAAALEPKAEDPFFAFYRRPTKAELIKEV